KPLSVKIIEPASSLVADRRYEVLCETTGSRPNAIITFYKGKRQLRRTKDETLNNTTRSELSFVPSVEDDGKTLTCRAENPKVTGLFLETTWKLNVVYPPIVTLRLGSTLSAEDIKDGEDVYFECHVQANPQWRKLYWLHDGIILTHNASARVIRSNQSLVLQRVTRSSSGNYSCSAVNAEGETVSNQLSLRVKYVPVCATDKVIIIGAFRGEDLNIVCEVESDPPPRSFRWKFNNSGETLDVGRERHHRNGSMRSILHYTPVSDQDYGTLSCWAQNEVGAQQNPCLFQIVLAGLPSAVKNCTVSNQTAHSVEIQCIAGYDGGLPQVFVLELVSPRTGKLRRVTRSSSGNYSCSAVNAEGETVSNQLSLRVKYVPVCATDKVIIIGAFRGEDLNIVCEVESDPPPRSFRWKFNNSGETLDVGRERHHRNGSMRSILHYTPVSDQDYGTLSCWAQNEVGAQQNPCLFQIVLAGLPSAVKNCTVSNQTAHSVEIQCIAGYDGGLPQVFVLELVSPRTGKLRYNITNTDEPIFVIESMENLMSFDSMDDRSLKVIVFAVNQKGRSSGVILRDFPFGGELENRSEASFDTSFHLSPIVFGTMLTLFILCCVILGRMYTSRRSHSNDTLSSSKQSSTLLCKQDPSKVKKAAKSNLRWQHSDSGVKEQVIGGAPGRESSSHPGGLPTEPYDVGDDERDPDVIPSQYVPDEMENCLATEWNHQDSIFSEQFTKHDNRPKDLLLKPLSSADFQLIAPTNSNYLQHQHDIVPNGELDINVHAIKTMLMATRVPESCV
uniref:Putative b-cell receptor cd22 n=1 Tax=Lutzomyia longipalpis TaxID=7200 RepID=A0A1B0EVK6_LUTLO